MSEQRVAYRYAKAMLELAEEQKVLDKVNEDMQLFIKICRDNNEFKLMLSNPVITHDKKLKILKALFEKRAHKIVNSFIEIISRKNRESILEATAKEFGNLYNIKKGISEASVTTTFKLDNKLSDEFKKAVKDMTGKDVLLSEKVNEEIIGGYILKIEDRQIDASVRTKLRELEYAFGEAPQTEK